VKEETSSPTVSTDVLMMSILIDAKERRDVTTVDVAGEPAGIMCDVSQEYKKFVCYENGKKVLYLELLKALYEFVQWALLWYALFSGTL
jgi:hypothetical protein